MQGWLVDQTGPGGEVVFYYSGHGYQQEDQNGDEADGYDETLVPNDTTVQDGRVLHMITDDEIEAILVKLADRSTRIVIDSCHSGTMTRGYFADDAYAKTPVGLPGRKERFEKALVDAHRSEEPFVEGTANRVVWTAVAAWQKALVDFESGSGSVFTNRFLSGLRDRAADANRDGDVSNGELLDYLQVESEAFCRRNQQRCRTGLTPTIEASKDLLVVSASRPPGAPEPQAPAPSTIEYVEESLSHTSEQDVSLTLLPGSSLRLGEALKVSVSSPIDGYLVLLDIDSADGLTQLFPNRFSGAAGGNRIRANTPVVVPAPGQDFELTAVEPAGKGHIVALVVEDRVDLSKVLNAHKDLEVVVDPHSYLQEISSELTRVWTDDSVNRRVKWSMREQAYEVLP
jgi:hypothetical protein